MKSQTLEHSTWLKPSTTTTTVSNEHYTLHGIMTSQKKLSNMHSIYFAITSRSVSYLSQVHQFQFKTKTKLFEPLTIQNFREVTSSVTTKPNDSKQKREWEKTNSAQSSEIIWIGSKWRKMNQWRCLLRTEDVKLFFLYKRTNNIEVKTQSLLQREQSNLGPLRKLRQFMIGEFWS